ncbi:myb-like protein P [Teleopsis dalmanni]|uniref:myb-like protein P n=1 Tax=Teleopsis dalmanni TaxID=139649 RepID=UPI0018CEB56F|nr:myb-like protein P [Teleopsis dalmanni]
MKLLLLSVFFAITLCVCCEPANLKRPLVFHHNLQSKLGKSSKQIAHSPSVKQKTLVVQIRSDQPVPLVLKGRSYAQQQLTRFRGPRPLKISTAPVYLQNGPLLTKPSLRKPIKIKLPSSNTKWIKPSPLYTKPFKYEKPAFSQILDSTAVQKLPLKSHVNFVANHFAPIHTIPAPNLAIIHDNQLHHEETYLAPESPKPQPYHQSNTNNNNQYKVIEDNTNDQTILDPLSGSQKLFAPDPDPSLPTSKIRPAVEPFNQPSNNKPLPGDVQNNIVTPAQPILQIVGGQHVDVPTSEIYPIQLQQYVTAVQPIPIYNPTYLVTQSNNLYSQHKQQLFQPNEDVVEAGYVNADLTQEVASNGQILQAAKDPYNNIHPVLDSAPQFAALIAAPSLGEEQIFQSSSLHLPNGISINSATENGFAVSNYYKNAQDSSQLLQVYAEEEARNQQIAQEQQEHQQLLIQQQNHLLELQQQHQQQQINQPIDAAASAFEEHQRLVKQQLGANTPLRIFVPDEEELRLQKRSDEKLEDSEMETDFYQDFQSSEALNEIKLNDDSTENNSNLIK